MVTKWPRVVGSDNHYLLHKVKVASINNEGILRFLFVHEDGREYYGPSYTSLVNGELPYAEKILKRHGLTAVSEIKFLVAYHSGCYPNGFPIVLLKNEEDIPRHLTMRS